MHLLIVGLQWPPEPFIGRQLAGLLARGVRVAVAVRRVDHTPVGGLEGAELVLIGAASGTPADVVHFEWNSAAIDALPEPALWRAPAVISCRGTQIRVRPHVTPGYAERLRETFDRAAAVHCVCEAIRSEAISLGLDAAKAEVIFPAVDVDEFTFAPHPAAGGPLRLLAVGNLIWTKGCEYALSTLRALLDLGVPATLEMIGDGNERQRALFTVHDLGLREHVTFRPSVPTSQVREAMHRADVFLHSSLSEGISNAVLEAMACGLPVVTTDCGGMREAVRDKLDGYVVPMRDPGAAAGAVEKLARDAASRERMGRSGRTRVEEKFRLDEQIERFVALYRRVAGAGVSV